MSDKVHETRSTLKVNLILSILKIKQAVVLKYNNPSPHVLLIAASRGFSELTKNVIRSSHGHSTTSLKISCKSVQRFSRNLAEIQKERKGWREQRKEGGKGGREAEREEGRKEETDINLHKCRKCY